MHVLVTGGAGFIGSHVVDLLLEQEANHVVALDNFDEFYAPKIKRANIEQASRNPRFSLVEGDIRDRKLVFDLIAGGRFDSVVHLAARAGVRPSLEDPTLYVDVNVGGTTNILEASKTAKKPPKIVFASSSSVYGDRLEGPFRESDPVDWPVSPYAATKRSCELMAHVYHSVYGLAISGLRFFTAYGPRNRPDLAIAKFARLIERGEPTPMFGDGTTKRDYTYVEDVASGVVKALEFCKAFHIYNLGNSSPVTLRHMIELIAQAVGKPALIEQKPEQPGDVKQTFADISLARAELGYEPKTPFSVGLGRYVEWLRSERG